MKNKLILLIIILAILLSGCLQTDKEIKNNVTEKLKKINYIEKGNIIDTKDFPEFKLIDKSYYIAPENLPLTLETEMGHGIYEMNESTEVIKGYRIYGSSEAYNSSKRYIVLQYKVFDTNESLNEVINSTVDDIYIRNGFKNISINNTYNQRVVVLESNATNNTDMNIIVILFGFDTVIGKVGIQDYKDKSINESLKILDTFFEKIKIETKYVESVKLNKAMNQSVLNQSTY